MPQEQEYRLKFRIPSVRDVDVYFIRLEDGKIVARTREELEEEKKEEEKEKRE